MKQNQPQLLKGFRDFLPEEKRKRDFVMRKTTDIFEKYGFDPLETPTIEYRETIMGKYGDEADKLVYEFKDKGDRDVALRYDQTVPTARVIAMYQNDLPMPFRRYQAQNVFRADKPQRGRYREFTQCDIDIFGSKDPMADAEILACTYAAYKSVGFSNVILRVNDRELLISTLSPFATGTVSVFSIIQSLDKLDKMSKMDVQGELEKKGLSRDEASNVLMAMESVEPSEKLSLILRLAENLGVDKESLEFSPTTARGLDYYTGMIFEVRIPGYDVGSVGGGGRYDNLISDLSGLEMPAVGMAFGFDRTVEAAQDLGVLNSEEESAKKRILVTVFDDSFEASAAMLANELRSQGLCVEVYPRRTDLSKQLKYADRKGIQFVLVQGSQEKERNVVLIKNLRTGKQEEVSPSQVSSFIK